MSTSQPFTHSFILMIYYSAHSGTQERSPLQHDCELQFLGKYNESEWIYAASPVPKVAHSRARGQPLRRPYFA